MKVRWLDGMTSKLFPCRMSDGTPVVQVDHEPSLLFRQRDPVTKVWRFAMVDATSIGNVQWELCDWTDEHYMIVRGYLSHATGVELVGPDPDSVRTYPSVAVRDLGGLWSYLPAELREDGWYYLIGASARSSDGWAKVPAEVVVTLASDATITAR